MKPSELSAAELVRACLDTSEVECWAEFISRYQSLISGVIGRIVSRHMNCDPGLVDDLVQETYLRLCRDKCRSLREFKPEREESIFGFLKVVASSVALDYFRAHATLKRGPSPTQLDESTERFAVSQGTPTDDLLLCNEMWRTLDGVIQSERDVTIFRMYYQQGFTAKEIAALPNLGLSVKGVESCLHRLSVELRRVLRPPAGTKGQETRMSFGDV
jgi:RNA polymerase sigma-70 factor (ECF subfamily)